MVARLSRPGIVGIHDVETEGRTFFLVMEWIEGRSLADALQGGALAPGEAIRIA